MITNDLTKQLKNDIKFLKKVSKIVSRTFKWLNLFKESNNKKLYTIPRQVSDLKTVNEDKGKRNQFFEHSKEVRKAARRELRQLKKAEIQKEKQWQEVEAMRQAKEDAELNAKAVNGEGPTNSIGPLIDFVSSHFVLRLPAELCQGCNKRLLPDDPTMAAAIFEADNKKRQGVFGAHIGGIITCLNKVLTKPPFGLQGCPACGLRIWHHEWERDIKRLERRWAAKQARERELNEVADSFGGLGDEFIIKRKKKKDSDDDDEESSEDDPEDVDAKASAALFEKW